MDKIVAIGPSRVLVVAKAKFPNLQYPDDIHRIVNRERVRNAFSLVLFFDEMFKQSGKSIGTKVEIVNNSSKIKEAYFYTGSEFVLSPIPVIDEKLPSWDEYVSGTM